MAKKSGFEKAQASVLKALRNIQETVSGMVAFDEPENTKTKKKKKKKAKKAKKGKSQKARGR
jgi:hypothetical protein